MSQPDQIDSPQDAPEAPEAPDAPEAQGDRKESFPFTRPTGSDANMFIQWKGTDVCLDFHCPCGAHGHFDGYFAYRLRCPSCDAVYELGTQVIVKRIDPDVDPRAGEARMLDVDPDPRPDPRPDHD